MYMRTLFLLLFSQAVMAGPWWTGPLLAPSGKTIPAGHINYEQYGFYSRYQGGMNNLELMPILSVGLTDFMDAQTALPLDHNWIHGQQDTSIGDYSLGLGFQLLQQHEQSWIPDLRFFIQEVFPTGRFENLSTVKSGADRTGTGAYQTTFGLNFQRLTTLSSEHYLRTRLSFVAALASGVTVHGLNAYGGGLMTEGRVRPGNSYSADLAFEYSLTQQIAPVFEMLYVNSSANNFIGNPGFTPGGTLASIGGAGGDQLSLAPAIEYNFTPSIGLIAGVWFSASGPPSSRFVTGALALNCYF